MIPSAVLIRSSCVKRTDQGDHDHDSGSQPVAGVRRTDGHQQRCGGRGTSEPVRPGHEPSAEPTTARDERPHPGAGRPRTCSHTVRPALGRLSQIAARRRGRTEGRSHPKRPTIMAAHFLHSPQRRSRSRACPPPHPPDRRRSTRGAPAVRRPRLQGTRPAAQRLDRPRRHGRGPRTTRHPQLDVVHRTLRRRRRRRFATGPVPAPHPG